MPDIDKNEKPWPYIKFMHVKKNCVGTKETGVKIEEVVEPCYYKANGCHGTKEFVAEIMKNNKVLVGYGNLKPGQRELKGYLDTILGVSVDPRLQAIRESVLGERLDERRRNKSNT